MSNTMNTAADRDRRQQIGATRGRDLYWGITIGVFSNIATLAILSMDSGLDLAISAMILGTLVFVLVNSFDCMDDLKANAQDMDDDEAQTHFGQKFAKAPWGMFKTLVALSFGFRFYEENDLTKPQDEIVSANGELDLPLGG